MDDLTSAVSEYANENEVQYTFSPEERPRVRNDSRNITRIIAVLCGLSQFSGEHLYAFVLYVLVICVCACVCVRACVCVCVCVCVFVCV